MSTPFESFVTTELPKRPAMLTSDNTGYDGDPNSGAPPIIDNSPIGTFYLKSTGNILYKKNGTGAGTWDIIGSSSSGGMNELVYHPAGPASPGVVTTWADVDAFAQAAAVPWTLYIDGSYGDAEIPSGWGTDFRGLCTIRNAEIIGSTLTIRDGSVIVDICAIIGKMRVVCESLITGGFITLQLGADGGVFLLKEGASIENVAGLSNSASLSINTSGWRIVLSQGGHFNRQEPSAPMIEFVGTMPASYIIETQQNSSGLFKPVPDNSILGPASKSLHNEYDSTSVVGDQSLTFLGTRTYNAFERSELQNWDHGTTADRHAGVEVPLIVGQMYFDTDLGIPIWWNGSAWVDVTGTPV